MRLEHRDEPLAPRHRFLRRLAIYASVALLLLGFALGLGVLGYRHVADLAWIDALQEAAMILAGMGPVSPMPTSEAKVFAAAYALASGILFLTTVSLLLAPVVHRVLHRMHLGDEADDDDDQGRRLP